MPFEKGNQYSKGVSEGKTGRKSAMEESAKARAIVESWEKVVRNINKQDVTKVALPIVLKDMVTKVGNPDGSNIVIPIYAGESVQKHEGDKKDIQPDKED